MINANRICLLSPTNCVRISAVSGHIPRRHEGCHLLMIDDTIEPSSKVKTTRPADRYIVPQIVRAHVVVSVFSLDTESRDLQ